VGGTPSVGIGKGRRAVVVGSGFPPQPEHAGQIAVYSKWLAARGHTAPKPSYVLTEPAAWYVPGCLQPRALATLIVGLSVVVTKRFPARTTAAATLVATK
jgi:hypothetical protein